MRYFDFAFLKKDRPEEDRYWDFYFEEDDYVDDAVVRGELYEWKDCPVLFTGESRETRIKGSIWETEEKMVKSIKETFYHEDSFLERVDTEDSNSVMLLEHKDPSVRIHDNLIESGDWWSRK